MISDKRASGSKQREESYSSVAGYGDQIRQFFANVRDPAKVRSLVIGVALKLDAVFSAADAFQNGAAVEKELGSDLVKGLIRYCRNMQLQETQIVIMLGKESGLSQSATTINGRHWVWTNDVNY